jgi:hypothetical protein
MKQELRQKILNLIQPARDAQRFHQSEARSQTPVSAAMHSEGAAAQAGYLDACEEILSILDALEEPQVYVVKPPDDFGELEVFSSEQDADTRARECTQNAEWGSTVGSRIRHTVVKCTLK